MPRRRASLVGSTVVALAFLTSVAVLALTDVPLGENVTVRDAVTTSLLQAVRSVASESVGIVDRLTTSVRQAIRPTIAPESVSVVDGLTTSVRQPIRPATPDSVRVVDQVSVTLRQLLRAPTAESVRVVDAVAATVRAAIRTPLGESVVVRDAVSAVLRAAIRPALGESVGVRDAVTLTVLRRPTITADPANATALAGTPVTFTVGASGMPLAYQWQVSTDGGASFTDMAAATSPSLQLTPVLADAGKRFRAVVTNTLGSATSAPARLDVFDYSLAIDPPSRTIFRGQPTTFTLTSLLAPGSTGAPATIPLELVGAPFTVSATAMPLPGTIILPIDSVGIALGDFSFLVESSIDGGTRSVLGSLHTYDFSISVQPASRTVPIGGGTTYSVTAQLAAGSSVVLLPPFATLQPVTGLPAGTTFSFTPGATVDLFGSPTTLAIATGSNTPPGTSTFTVHSVLNSIQRDATATLVVEHSICVLYDQARVFSGRAASIRIALCDASGADLSTPLIRVRALSFVMGAVTVPARSVGAANVGEFFRFDATLSTRGGYVYSAAIGSLASGTWQLVFEVEGDPLPHSVQFVLR